MWEKLKELLIDPATVLKDLKQYHIHQVGPTDVGAEIISLEKRHEKLLGRRRRLIEVYVSGSVEKEMFETESLKLKLQIDEVESQLAFTKSKLMSDADISARVLSVQQLYERYRAKLSQASDEVKREIFSLFIRRIKVDGANLHIQVNLPEPDAFAGQASRRLSRKQEPSIVLHAKLLTQSDIWKQKDLVRNLGRWARKERR